MSPARAALAFALVFAAGGAFGHAAAEERVAALTARIAAAPDNPDLYLSRGIAYRDHEQWDAALQDFRAAAALLPARAGPRVFEAKTLLDAGRTAQAWQLADELAQSYPCNADARLVRARVARAQQNWLLAAADLEVAIGLLDPPVPEVFLDRARSLAAAGPEHIDDALATLAMGVERLGPVSSLIRYAVDISMSPRHADAGLAALDALPDRVAVQPRWLMRRGDLLAAQGHGANARDVYRAARKALESMPPARRDTRAMKTLAADLDTRISDPGR